MRGFRHQHTSDLSASLTCSTMSFDIGKFQNSIDVDRSAVLVTSTNRQKLSDSVKMLLMKLLVKSLLSKDNFVAVVSLAEELLFEAADSVYLHYALGTAFSKIGDNDKAIYHCRKFLEIDPIQEDKTFKQDNLATVHNNLAVCLKTVGFLDQAEEQFRYALKIDDEFSAAFNNFGNLLNDKARIAEARQCFLRAIEINPEDHIAYWNLHSTANSLSEAEAIVEACLTKAKDDEVAVFTLAGLRAFSGDLTGIEELKSFGFENEPMIRSIEWILSLPKTPEIFFNRWAVFDRAVQLADRDRAFYEFGVWMGDSFKYLVPHFNSGVGFDSFQGLPEDWGVVPKGAYSSRGRVPDISNSEFVVGEFAQTLERYFSVDRKLAGLVNFDADLYSSTLCALSNARSVIDTNTILIFDEFIVNNEWEKDEFKALNEFCEEIGMTYEVIAVSLFTKQMVCKLVSQ